MIDLEAIAKRAENATLTPFKTFPIVFLPNAEGVLLEEYKLINEYLALGLSARTDIPLLLNCVRELREGMTDAKAQLEHVKEWMASLELSEYQLEQIRHAIDHALVSFECSLEELK